MFKRSSAFPFGGTLGGTPRALAALKGKTEKTHIMATPGSSNPGHEAFLVHLDTLRAAVTDPGGLATALYSRGAHRSARLPESQPDDSNDAGEEPGTAVCSGRQDSRQRGRLRYISITNQSKPSNGGHVRCSVRE